MGPKKQLDVSASSMINFKAELFRKQDQFRVARSQAAPPTSVHGSKKKPAWLVDNNPDAQNTKKKTRSKTVVSTEVEPSGANDERLELSRRTLEQKAKLYEALAAEGAEDGDGEACLVDFERKAMDSDWVEYVDSLGRTRKCLREDVEIHRARDADLRALAEVAEETHTDEIAAERVVREEEGEEMRDVHYEDLRGTEVRSHGVGYYGFSVETEERQRQLDALGELRKATEEQRSKREEVLRKRKLQLAERLKKVKQRRGITETEMVETDVVEKDQLAPDVVEKDPGTPAAVVDSVAVEIGSRVAALRAELEGGEMAQTQGTGNKLHKREWDRGKMEPGSEYREAQRQARTWEFAPPPSYQ